MAKDIDLSYCRDPIHITRLFTNAIVLSIKLMTIRCNLRFDRELLHTRAPPELT